MLTTKSAITLLYLCMLIRIQLIQIYIVMSGAYKKHIIIIIILIISSTISCSAVLVRFETLTANDGDFLHILHMCECHKMVGSNKQITQFSLF